MMENKLGFRLNAKEDLRKQSKNLYRLVDIQSMTTHQLREICRKERIIDGIVNSLDKQELIRIIMRYRGAALTNFIKEENADGRARLEKALINTQIIDDRKIMGNGWLIVYQGRGVHFYDNAYMKYDERFIDTNALVVSSDRKICAIFNVQRKKNDAERMYLTRKAGLFSQESEQRNYDILFMTRNISDQLFDLYEGNIAAMPVSPRMYRFNLLHFQVKKPIDLPMPLIIDFGYNNTAVAAYLGSRFYDAHGVDENDSTYLKPHQMNEVSFYDNSIGGREEKSVPCCVSLRDLSDEDNPEWVFGYEALNEMLSNYREDGCSIVISMKDWMYDPDVDVEFIDRNGRRRVFLQRYLLGLYFRYLLTEAEDYFKCNVKEIYFTVCTKQKKLYAKFFSELLPKYNITEENILDESTVILYGTIKDLLKKKKLQMREEYKALIIDCGGSMINANSIDFSVENRRMSFSIKMKNTCWDSSMDFSGNLLTYRIMQLLKIYVYNRLVGTSEISVMKNYDNLWQNNGYVSIYRYVDDNGVDKLYSAFKEAYKQAEAYLPTHCISWGESNVIDYYRVRNNYVTLFRAAEYVKHLFYSKYSLHRLRIVDHIAYSEKDAIVGLDRWRFHVYKDGKFASIDSFEDIIIEKADIDMLLNGMVYNVMKDFVGELYDTGELDEYSIIRLTGQASYVDMFRTALSEFVAGIRIQSSTLMKRNVADMSIKCSGLSGAVSYLYDKRYGFADVEESYEYHKIPYNVVAYTHSNQRIVLIEGRKWNVPVRSISRAMDDLTLQLYLVDRNGKERTVFNYFCRLDEFVTKTYKDLAELYGDHIKQDDVDVIVDRETKFFVWAEPDKWGFTVLPICRYKENLWLGREQFFLFENGKWGTEIFMDEY